MRAIVILVSVALLGCGGDRSAAVEACEREIVLQVRSPSTMEIVGEPAFEDGDAPFVLIDFDAENVFGGTVRHVALCYMGRSQEGWRVDSIYVR